MLLLINGPPAVGKSTLARRYVDEHPLALLLEIDAIRCSLGGWQEHDESMQIARDLALLIAEAHLRRGFDVVVPQYLGRVEYIETLDALATKVDADFVEVILLSDDVTVADRFRRRQVELAQTDQAHPQREVPPDAIDALITQSIERLAFIASARAHTITIMAGDPAAGVADLRNALQR